MPTISQCCAHVCKHAHLVEKIEKIPLINTDFEEDFPIYDDINHVLYFSSNRESSFGGLDNYMVEYNHSSNECGEITHLDFPYNSPFDDFLYTPNFETNNAFFVSNRNGEFSKFELFDVSATISDVKSVDILATFNDELNLKNNQISIMVKHLETDQDFGPFNSNKEGELSTFLPVSGEYIYKSKISDSEKVYFDTIRVPNLSKNNYLSQTLNHKKVNTKADLIVITQLNDSRSEEISMNPLKFQEFSKMTVNSSIIEKVQLMVHVLVCKACFKSSRKNNQLTRMIRKANLHAFSESEKESLKERLGEQGKS